MSPNPLEGCCCPFWLCVLRPMPAGGWPDIQLSQTRGNTPLFGQKPQGPTLAFSQERVPPAPRFLAGRRCHGPRPEVWLSWAEGASGKGLDSWYPAPSGAWESEIKFC